MSRERELLERALEQADYIYFVTCGTETLAEEIREFLASEESEKRDLLSEEEILEGYVNLETIGQYKNFAAGVRFAEKHHGFGRE